MFHEEDGFFGTSNDWLTFFNITGILSLVLRFSIYLITFSSEVCYVPLIVLSFLFISCLCRSRNG